MSGKYAAETITSKDAGVSPMDGFTRVSAAYFLIMSRCQCLTHILFAHNHLCITNRYKPGRIIRYTREPVHGAHYRIHAVDGI